MEIVHCDMCKRTMPHSSPFRDNASYFRFKLRRRVLYLAVSVLQGKPGRRRRWNHGRRHLDLCKACALGAVLAARRAWKGPQVAFLTNPRRRAKAKPGK